MLTPEKMKQLNILVFDQDIDAVTEKIISLEAIHLVSVNELEAWGKTMGSVAIEQKNDRCQDSLIRIKHILAECKNCTPDILGSSLRCEEEELKEGLNENRKINVDAIENKLDEIELKIAPILLQRKSLREQLTTKKHIYAQIKMFSSDFLLFNARGKYSFLEVVSGKVKNIYADKIRRELIDVPHMLMPVQVIDDFTLMLIIVLKKDKAVLDKALKMSLFENVALPGEISNITGDVKSELRNHISKLEEQILDQESKLKHISKKFINDLMLYEKILKAKCMLMKTKSYFKKTNRTYLISGWIPQDKRDLLSKELSSVTSGRCYLEEQDTMDVAGVKEGKTEVPVRFKNPSFLKPFEFITKAFGLPKYNTIDPTFFVAITFFIMFGAMFGDIGHGFMLCLVAGILSYIKKGNLRRVGMLVAYCGVSSIIFGALYGSVFGVEDLIPALWMHPMRNIMHFMKVAVFFGVGVISIGITLNIINCIKTKNIVKGIFDKAGLVGGLLYWGCIGIISMNFIAKDISLRPVVILSIIGLPVFLLLLRDPIIKLFNPRHKMFHEGIGMYIIETIIEIGEIFIGYMSNTVSFIRVAAFSLAHTGLFIAVFSLVNFVSKLSGGVVYSTIILIVGNLFIVIFEGLIVTIQGLRLEYYEFFSKFFIGGGKEYRPVKAEK